MHRQSKHRWNQGKVFDRLFDLTNTADYDSTYPFFGMSNTYRFGSYRLASGDERPEEDNTPLDERDQVNDTRDMWINAGI